MIVAAQPWWKEAIVYQIYPASFQDSNGDGIGDLPGILSRIDYIKGTGADTIWICPMYDSPQHDMGYDISNYESVYPPYGTMEDMDAIIAACHERGVKIILDLVINHTSDEHAWFKESRSSKDNPKRDWYIWRPARYDANGNRKPPNNWASFFGGSAWCWDEETQEYYLHLFCPEQPDLNWETPQTREAIYETSMHFWLRKGVDGFRIDTANLYSKRPGLPDFPVTNPLSDYQTSMEVCNGPRMHEFISEMYEVLSQYGATMTIGELAATHGPKSVLPYVSAAAKQLNMAIQFDIAMLGGNSDMSRRFEGAGKNSWTLPELAKGSASIQSLMDGTDGWVTAFFENHDVARSVSRFGADTTEELRVRSAKMLAAFQATSSGTLILYQGQEIGMVNAPRDWPIDEYKDVASLNYYQSVKDRTGNDPAALERAMDGIQYLARDHTRIPLSWDASPNAGFTAGGVKPWMRIHDNYKLVNVQSQLSDKGSVYSFWKLMLGLRKEYADVFVHGTFHALQDSDLNVLVYEKRGSKRTAVVALNFSESDQPLHVPITEASLLLSTYGDDAKGTLRPFEGRVWIR